MGVTRLTLTVAALVVATGCGSPGSYSVSPDCPDLIEAVVVVDVVGAYCGELGVCMGRRPFPDSELVVTCESLGGSRAGNASHGLSGHRVRLDPSNPANGRPDLAWRVVAHELGHIYGLGHNPVPGTIMAAVATAGPMQLDESITGVLSQ